LDTDLAVKCLEDYLGKIILIKFKDDKLIRGILNGYDNHMNIVLNNAAEIQGKSTIDLGTIIVRGDNIIFISPSTS
tara:strand:+ start:970 stop:1197 length:228 start_codon:yes stop_codon:yes gene_type:complete